ncbi:GroES-like protein [Obba rivulosa]|uniref:GroES-like protein n=1 Tax=Obba rivulosa TaxID=1052685 RepID=A0A8E2DM01_9APHY|nr:GroES-like protein [Obba rivulosa]
MSTPEIEFKGYGITTTDPAKWSEFEVVPIKPKHFGPRDVDVAIKYCGVCGSDVHTLTGGWGSTPNVPLVVGHEIVGNVTRVGDAVTEFKPGDRVGVGAQIGSCGECRACKAGDENYCPKMIHTYNNFYPDGVLSQGGFSTGIRAHEQFVFKIPDGLELRDAATMTCAGLTVFSPLKVNGCGPGKTVGVIGIGGLGHYAILFAKAMGATVYAFSHSASKEADIQKMGADFVVSTHDPDYYQPLQGTIDIIISTIDHYSPDRPLKSYLSMLATHGRFITCGLPDADNPLPPVHPFDLTYNGCYIGGTHMGSKREAVEMLQLAADKGVKPWVQELPMSQAKQAIEGVKTGKARYRYVLKQDLVSYD